MTLTVTNDKPLDISRAPFLKFSKCVLKTPYIDGR